MQEKPGERPSRRLVIEVPKSLKATGPEFLELLDMLEDVTHVALSIDGTEATLLRIQDIAERLGGNCCMVNLPAGFPPSP